jgi:hypothetical protein
VRAEAQLQIRFSYSWHLNGKRRLTKIPSLLDYGGILGFFPLINQALLPFIID